MLTAQPFHFENDKVEIKPSLIHGMGLFATRDLLPGDVIGFYEGPVVEEDGDHVLWIQDEDEGIEYGIDGQTETRFVNHSRQPNANFNGEVLEALRAIRQGEEITHDYGEAWADLG
jgi:SET domain-containing protein